MLELKFHHARNVKVNLMSFCAILWRNDFFSLVLIIGRGRGDVEPTFYHFKILNAEFISTHPLQEIEPYCDGHGVEQAAVIQEPIMLALAAVVVD